MSDVYLGNPLLKKANTPIEFTQSLSDVDGIRALQLEVLYCFAQWGP